MGLHPVHTTWLEMLERPRREAAPAPEGIVLGRVPRCSAAFFRFLYHEVGHAWEWVDRSGWREDQLNRHLDRLEVEIHLLTARHEPAGFAELERMGGACQIVYFGLRDRYQGQGLGRWFLDQVVDIAWNGDIQRVWLHTCELDHPAALHCYQQAGFQVYKEGRVSS